MLVKMVATAQNHPMEEVEGTSHKGNWTLRMNAAISWVGLKHQKEIIVQVALSWPGISNTNNNNIFEKIYKLMIVSNCIWNKYFL